jgi:beta-barrel assembly-enhancing protease
MTPPSPKFVPHLPEEQIHEHTTRPVRELLILFAGIASVIVGLVIVVSLVVDFGVRQLPADLEARWFGGLWDALFMEEEGDREGERQEHARAARLQPLAERLARHWEGCPYQVRVHALDEETPNAAALPGGLVLVTTGLLDAVDSENALAFVLAHELGHFKGRDHLRRLGRSLVLTLFLSALTGSASAGELPGLLQEIAGSRYDRKDELAADRFALELVHAEYGHVADAAGFFEAMAARDERLPEALSYLSTHPDTRARVRALHAAAWEQGWPEEGEVVPLP